MSSTLEARAEHLEERFNRSGSGSCDFHVHTLAACLRAFVTAATTLLVAWGVMGANAQEVFPNRAVSLVVPFPPGGVADIVARTMAPFLEREFKQGVVVVNRAGAGGSLGTAFVANSKPDGHTLLMALASISTNPEQERLNNRPPAFRLNQLVPLARISLDPMMLAVRAGSSYQNVAELVDDAKKRPGSISYASSGVYGVYHIATEMLSLAASAKFNHVPYSGGAPALLALLSGQVDFSLVTRSVALPHLKEGKLRPLAAWGDERWQDFPDVRSLKEEGLPVAYSLWSGMFAPVGTPEKVLVTLREAIRLVVANSQFKDRMRTLEVQIAYQDAPDFRTFWDADAARLNRVVREIGKLE